MAAVLLWSPVLFVFPLATTAAHQSSFFVFVRKSPPQGHIGCRPLLAVRRFPTDRAGFHCTYTTNRSAHCRQPSRPLWRWSSQTRWTWGGVQALAESVRHQSAGVWEKPVWASAHSLGLYCVHLRKAGEGGVVRFQPRRVGGGQQFARRRRRSLRARRLATKGLT